MKVPITKTSLFFVSLSALFFSGPVVSKGGIDMWIIGLIIGILFLIIVIVIIIFVVCRKKQEGDYNGEIEYIFFKFEKYRFILFSNFFSLLHHPWLMESKKENGTSDSFWNNEQDVSQSQIDAQRKFLIFFFLF